MNANRIEALKQAELLADNLRSLAVGYQDAVRVGLEEGRENRDDSERTKRSLDLKFQKLRPRNLIDELAKQGCSDVASRLDELWKATAMVFNLLAVSVGVDEVEVLDIDIEEPYCQVLEAIRRTSDE